MNAMVEPVEDGWLGGLGRAERGRIRAGGGRESRQTGLDWERDRIDCGDLGWIQIPGLDGLIWASRICVSNVADADPSSPIRVSSVRHRTSLSC